MDPFWPLTPPLPQASTLAVFCLSKLLPKARVFWLVLSRTQGCWLRPDLIQGTPWIPKSMEKLHFFAPSWTWMLHMGILKVCLDNVAHSHKNIQASIRSPRGSWEPSLMPPAFHKFWEVCCWPAQGGTGGGWKEASKTHLAPSNMIKRTLEPGGIAVSEVQ